MYTTKKRAFNLTEILDQGKSLALVEDGDVERVLSALKLYDTLKQEFASIIKQSEEKIAKFDEYVGITSNWIVKLGYDRANRLLKVVKKDSSIAPEVVMIYKDVPSDIFVKLLTADSAGAVYNKLVRNKYEREDLD